MTTRQSGMHAAHAPDGNHHGASGLTEDAWRQMGSAIANRRGQLDGMGSRQMWEIGDWLVAGEDDVFKRLNRAGVRELAAGITGYAPHTLSMAASVARRVSRPTRIDGLTWWHHLAVAKLDQEQQSEWLTQAAVQEWSVKRLRSALQQAGKIRRRSPPRPKRLVAELVRLSRAEIPESAMRELDEWWRRQRSPEPPSEST